LRNYYNRYNCSIDIIAQKGKSVYPIEIKSSLILQTTCNLEKREYNQADRAIGQSLLYWHKLSKVNQIENIFLLTGDEKALSECKEMIDFFELPISLMTIADFQSWARAHVKKGLKSERKKQRKVYI